MTAVAAMTEAIISEDIIQTEESIDEKNRRNQEKHIASVNNIIALHSAQPVLHLKTSKIKDAINGLIINPDSKLAKDELKKAKVLVNVAEQKELADEKRAFEAKHPGSKFSKKFEPKHKYEFSNISQATKDQIRRAIEREQSADKDKYAKSIVKGWKEDDENKYMSFLEFKKNAIEKAENDDGEVPSLADIMNSFDSDQLKRYSYVFRVKTKVDGEIKETTYHTPTKIPEEKRYDVYKALLTKGNVRFSKSSQTYISLFIESMAKQVAYNSLFNARSRGAERINSESLYLTENVEFLKKFVPLSDLIKFTKTYSEIATSKFTKEKKPRQKKEDKLAKKTKEDSSLLTVSEKVEKIISQDHYVKNQVSNNCKCEIAQDLGEGFESPYYRIKYSSSYVQFVSQIMGEIVYKIGCILKTQVSANKSRTINLDLVKTAIEHLLIVMNVSDVDIRNTFVQLDAKFGEYESTKKSSVKESSEEDL